MSCNARRKRTPIQLFVRPRVLCAGVLGIDLQMTSNRRNTHSHNDEVNKYHECHHLQNPNKTMSIHQTPSDCRYFLHFERTCTKRLEITTQHENLPQRKNDNITTNAGSSLAH
ncbi:hypothetical protein G9A89_001998 [Geosiphon pyriformis]|nr:hypothetical protein G9A89_001998 [Geosiphon pyriformis]